MNETLKLPIKTFDLMNKDVEKVSEHTIITPLEL